MEKELALLSERGIIMYEIDQAVTYLKKCGVTFFKSDIFFNTQDDFLKKYGLPQLNGVFVVEDLRFWGKDEFHTIKSKYLSVGYDGVGTICINLNTNEIISLTDETFECYINNNMAEFVYFIYLYKSLFLDKEVVDDDTEYLIFKILNDTFNSIDPKALAKESNWWSEVIEPLEFGLM